MQTRKSIPGLPYHIVQCGNDSKHCFIEAEDYEYYLDLWKTTAVRYGVKVHAYCLMTNHIDFLVTPETESAISNLMDVISNRYKQHISSNRDRAENYCDSHHQLSLVQSDTYLLKCMLYIDLNPVREAMVDKPERYSWSSYAVNTGDEQSWLTPHVEYLRLGSTPTERQYSYRELFKHQLSDVDLNLIRNATHYCQPIGSERFKRFIEEKYSAKQDKDRLEIT